MMRTTRFLAGIILFSLAAGVAWAQEEEQEAGGGVAAQASIDSDGESTAYPSFSIGAKLELVSLPVFSGAALLNPALLEASFDIFDRLSLFAVLGTYLGLRKQDTEFTDEKNNEGHLLLGGGVRFNFMQPQPKHAHLYAAADFIGAIGLGSVKLDGEDDSDEEEAATKANREQADHFRVGGALGIEYLPVSEFGIGSELGLRLYYNSFEDTLEDVDVNKYYEAYLVTSFGLRFTYHF